MEFLLNGEIWIALLTLSFLEIVLGVDNIIFISIVANRLPQQEEAKARRIGLILAMVFRIILIFGIMWIVKLDKPLFTIFDLGISGKNIILMIGGLFLLGKSVSEIHGKMEGAVHNDKGGENAKMFNVILQITALNIVFSFDSILTAVGLVDLSGAKYSSDAGIVIMVTSVIISMVVMMLFSGGISRFIAKHPTLEILALSFLILIGFMLMLEGFHQEIPKGYIYFAVFFAVVVEVINMRVRKQADPVKLHKPEYIDD